VSTGHALADIHPAVEEGVNNRDLDRLMALYAEDARMVTMDGSIAEGRDAIREQWAWLLAQEGHMTLQTRYVIEVGDLAILSNAWRFRAGDEEMLGTTAEVARREPDGSCLYIIDHPFAHDANRRDCLRDSMGRAPARTWAAVAHFGWG
jgi:uncharacterized protein (TIGR02246 family)